MGGDVGDEAYQYRIDALQTVYDSEGWKGLMVKKRIGTILARP